MTFKRKKEILDKLDRIKEIADGWISDLDYTETELLILQIANYILCEDDTEEKEG